MDRWSFVHFHSFSYHSYFILVLLADHPYIFLFLLIESSQCVVYHYHYYYLPGGFWQLCLGWVDISVHLYYCTLLGVHTIMSVSFPDWLCNATLKFEAAIGNNLSTKFIVLAPPVTPARGVEGPKNWKISAKDWQLKRDRVGIGACCLYTWPLYELLVGFVQIFISNE